MEEQPVPQFRGVFIPARIWRDKQLSWMEKALLAEIDALDDGNGCFASNAHLAKVMGDMTDKAVANKVSLLRTQGYIVDRGYRDRRRLISACYAPEARAAKAAIEAGSLPVDGNPAFPPTGIQPSRGRESSFPVDGNAYIEGSSGETSGEAEQAPLLSEAPSAPDEQAPEAKPEKRAKPAPSEQGEAFAKWFQTLLPEHLRNQTANQLADWGRLYDDLLRLDKRTKEQIVFVCEWARADGFWQKNFFTPLKLREKSDGAGIKYFDLFLERLPKGTAPKTGKPNVSIPTKKEAHEFTKDAKPEQKPKGGGFAAMKAAQQARLDASKQKPTENLNLPLQ